QYSFVNFLFPRIRDVARRTLPKETCTACGKKPPWCGFSTILHHMFQQKQSICIYCRVRNFPFQQAAYVVAVIILILATRIKATPTLSTRRSDHRHRPHSDNNPLSGMDQTTRHPPPPSHRPVRRGHCCYAQTARSTRSGDIHPTDNP